MIFHLFVHASEDGVFVFLAPLLDDRFPSAVKLFLDVAHKQQQPAYAPLPVHSEGSWVLINAALFTPTVINLSVQ